MEVETYRVAPEKHGKGTYFITDCGNTMYSVKDEMAYNGCLCPKCLIHILQVASYVHVVVIRIKKRRICL